MLLAGCGDEDADRSSQTVSAVGGGAAGMGMPTPTQMEETTAATFTEVYEAFKIGCGCHIAGGGGIDMTTKLLAYQNLVEVASKSCPGELRVTTADPERSVLMHTLDHSTLGSCAPPTMPRKADKWPDADLERVRAWIAAGALDD